LPQASFLDRRVRILSHSSQSQLPNIDAFFDTFPFTFHFIISAANQSNFIVGAAFDGFGSPSFVAFLFIVILVIFPIGLALLLLIKTNIIEN
jgi:hypothetical protein